MILPDVCVAPCWSCISCFRWVNHWYFEKYSSRSVGVMAVSWIPLDSFWCNYKTMNSVALFWAPLIRSFCRPLRLVWTFQQKYQWIIDQWISATWFYQCAFSKPDLTAKIVFAWHWFYCSCVWITKTILLLSANKSVNFMTRLVQDLVTSRNVYIIPFCFGQLTEPKYANY